MPDGCIGPENLTSGKIIQQNSSFLGITHRHRNKLGQCNQLTNIHRALALITLCRRDCPLQGEKLNMSLNVRIPDSGTPSIEIPVSKGSSSSIFSVSGGQLFSTPSLTPLLHLLILLCVRHVPKTGRLAGTQTERMDKDNPRPYGTYIRVGKADGSYKKRQRDEHTVDIVLGRKSAGM